MLSAVSVKIAKTFSASSRNSGKLQKSSLLDSATTMREYNERRNAIPHLVLRPDVPPDEMNMKDYMKLREPNKWYHCTHAHYTQALKNAKRATEG